MPRQTSTQIADRQVLAEAAGRPVQLQVHAIPVNIPAPMAETNDDLNGLIAGLKAFSPGLERYLDAQNEADAAESKKLGQTAANSVADPSKVVNEPVAVPEAVNPAFSSSFIEAYNQVLGVNLGHQVKTHILGEYEKQRNSEGFDSEQFLQQSAKKEMAGIKDLTLRHQVAKSIQEAAHSVREAHRKQQLMELQESGKAALTSSLDSAILPGMTAEQMHGQVESAWKPLALKTGLFTRPELSQLIVNKLAVLSDQLGGRPEFFDMTHIKDASGRAISDSPELGLKIEELKQVAKAKRDKSIIERDAESQARKRIDLENRIASVSDQEIWENFHYKFGVFKSDDEVWAFMRRRQATRDAANATSVNLDLIRTGQAWRIDKKEEAETAFNMLTDGYADGIVKAATSGDPQAVSEASVLMHQMIGIHAQSGRDMANKKVKNLFSGLATEVPKEGQPPSSKFMAAVEMYRAMPSNLRELYAEGDVKSLMSNYLWDVENRVDPQTAYQNAFRSISPESKKMAEERLKSPEVQTKIAGYVTGESTSFWRNMAAKVIPFDEKLGIYPDNESIVGAAAQLEARRFLEKNPNASDARLKEHIQEFARSRYTYEPTSNKLVEIPPGTDPRKAQDAFQLYTQEFMKQHGKDADVQLVYKQNGTYQVLSLRDQHSYGEVTLPKLMKELENSKVLVQESGEAAQFADLKKRLLSGQVSTAELDSNAKLIAKARSVGAWNTQLEMKLEAARQGAFEKTRSTLFRNVPQAYNDELTKAPPRGMFQEMGEVSKKFMAQGDMTAALITMGEGVVTRVYNDPARGRNIGMGYNLDANAATLKEDFRRAGIPAESIESITSGKQELTQDQAMRLLKVVIPRYEQVAQKGLEKLHPGEWAKLPPNQKAALTDLAYQVGSVDDFPKALSALIAGNTAEAGSNLAVTYKKRGTGERVVDTRRNNLRYQMLTNPNGFAGLQEYARKINTPVALQY